MTNSSLHTPNIADELAHDPGLLQVVVVSPARPIYEGAAKSLIVEAASGSMGVLPRHADIVAALGAGPLRIQKADGSEDRFAVWGGFLKVGGLKVTILVDRAVGADEVIESEVKQELDETLQSLRHAKSDEDFANLLETRAWCQARLTLVR